MWNVARGTRGIAVAGTLVAAFGLTGCAAKVTREDFNTEVAKIRQEMQAGDAELAGRLDEHERRMDALEQELQALRSEYEVTVERLEGMLRFNVPVHFDFASSELREIDQPVLERFAQVVREHYPNALVTVEGFTDPAGSRAYNERLGLQRAEAVKGFLVATGGMSDAQLRTVSYGEVRERQVAPGAQGPGERGLANRRVAFVIDDAMSTESPENQQVTAMP